jgi:hypothetical protein
MPVDRHSLTSSRKAGQAMENRLRQKSRRPPLVILETLAAISQGESACVAYMLKAQLTTEENKSIHMNMAIRYIRRHRILNTQIISSLRSADPLIPTEITKT